jgi:quercetin dioxygenase-like cupin family protein
MAVIVRRPGEGEAVFGRRIVIKADLAQLCVSESWYRRAQPGADPHVHRAHADSFYVLEGTLEFLVDDEEHALGPGDCVCAPPGVVHGFRSATPARFLNFHTPDGGFAANLRARDRGEPGGFDSFDAAPGSGLRASEAILLGAGDGERLEADGRVATIKVTRDELSVVELELEPGYEGPALHAHDGHVDSFYVLEGEAAFALGDEQLVLGAGSFVAVPPGVAHTFASGNGRARLLNVHAPSAGFHDWLREQGGPDS